MSDELYYTEHGYGLYPAAKDDDGYYNGGACIHEIDWNDWQYYDNVEVARISENGKIYVKHINETGQESEYYYVNVYGGNFIVTTFDQYGYDQESFSNSYNRTETSYESIDEPVIVLSHNLYKTNKPPNFFNSNIPVFNNDEDIQNYIDNGDITNAENYDDLTDSACDVKCYVDGTKKPSFKFTWKPKNEDVIPDNITISYIAYTTLELQWKSGHITIPFANGSYSATWDYLFENVGVSTAFSQKIDFKCSCVILDSSGEYDRSWGEVGGRCTKKAETTVTIPENNHMTFEFIEGSGEDDNGYDDPLNESDDPRHHNDYDGKNALTRTYEMTLTDVHSLGNFMWTNTLMDDLRKLNNSPMENIVSLKAMPLTIGGTSSNIILGNIDTGVTANLTGNDKIEFDMGSVTIPSINGGNDHWFYDESPYSNLTIYLPWIGFKTLDISLFTSGSIKVTYLFDTVTGTCEALIWSNRFNNGWQMVMSFSGNCGIDIPVTSSNRAQVEASIIQAGIGAVMSGVNKDVSGVVNNLMNGATTQFHSNTQGSPSPSCAAYMQNNAFIMIDRPVINLPQNYGTAHGYVCNQRFKLEKLHGYTECFNPKLDGINATDQEKEMISALLTSGIYL